MKGSDSAMDTESGNLIARASGLGTVTEAMVTKRAKEIAVINNRDGNAYTPDDYAQARRELAGIPNSDEAELEIGAPGTGDWSSEGVDKGHKAPVRPARDEQVSAEDLVKQGVDEATHHTMLAGNQFSRESNK